MDRLQTPYYEGWVNNISWQLSDLIGANIGAPRILDTRLALSRLPPVQIIYTTPLWNSVRSQLACILLTLTIPHFGKKFDYIRAEV